MSAPPANGETPAWLRTHVERRIPPRFRSLISPDDVVQECLVAWVRRGSAPLVDAHLRRLADQTLIDILRRLRTKKRGGVWRRAGRFSAALHRARDMRVSRSPGRAARRAEICDLLEAEVDLLDEARRDALRMRFLQGLSVAEIAQRLGRSRAAVHSLLYNGLRRLRRALVARRVSASARSF
jgi:RNA polymerase sigma-70 factor (ECF subfamily)